MMWRIRRIAADGETMSMVYARTRILSTPKGVNHRFLHALPLASTLELRPCPGSPSCHPMLPVTVARVLQPLQHVLRAYGLRRIIWGPVTEEGDLQWIMLRGALETIFA